MDIKVTLVNEETWRVTVSRWFVLHIFVRKIIEDGFLVINDNLVVPATAILKFEVV